MKKMIFLISITLTLLSCSSNDNFSGNWKSETGPKFGMPSALMITKESNNYIINLDNQKFTGQLDETSKRLNFKGYVLTYSKDSDELLLSPYMSVYKRN